MPRIGKIFDFLEKNIWIASLLKTLIQFAI